MFIIEKVFRVSLFSVILSVLAVIVPARAPIAQAGESQPAFKVRVCLPEKDGSRQNGCGAGNPAGDLSHLTLWLRLNWGEVGLRSEVNPVLDGRGSELSKEELQNFWHHVNQDPRVNDSLNAWRGWYDRLLCVARGAVDNKPPADGTRFKLTVTVNNDGTLAAFTDFADGRDSAESERYAQKIKSAFRNLNKKQIIAFPKDSSVKQVKFEVQTGSFRDIEIVSIGQPLGFK